MSAEVFQSRSETLTIGAARDLIARGGFTPAHIPGCELWLEGRRITGLNDNDPVTNWLDYSGNGKVATQATAGLKPLFQATTNNGKAAVRCDGLDDKLTLQDSGVVTANYSIFLVCKQTADADIAMISNIGQSAAGAGGSNFTMQQASGVAYVYWESSDNLYLFGTLVTPADGWLLIHLRNVGSTSQLIVNGTQLATNTGTNRSVRLGNGNIGYDFSNDYYFTSDIQALLEYDHALTAAEEALVTKYLGF